jgi:NarL family two-component system response regulator LiaR
VRTIRLIVADSHSVFREGLCRLLADEPEIEVVGKAVNGAEAVTLAETLKPDVAIIDVATPVLSGTEATKKIKRVSPQTAVLMVSAFNYQTHIMSCLRAGAAGFFTKDTPVRELVSAVRLAHQGEGTMDRAAVRKLIRRLTTDKARKRGSLDLYPREIEVLKLTAKGLRNKEIAKELKISERTVQSHLSNIFSKLDVDSRTEAVLEALKEGWLDVVDFMG